MLHKMSGRWHISVVSVQHLVENVLQSSWVLNVDIQHLAQYQFLFLLQSSVYFQKTNAINSLSTYKNITDSNCWKIWTNSNLRYCLQTGCLCSAVKFKSCHVMNRLQHMWLLQNLVIWCNNNHIKLNINKTKKLWWTLMDCQILLEFD